MSSKVPVVTTTLAARAPIAFRSHGHTLPNQTETTSHSITIGFPTVVPPSGSPGSISSFPSPSVSIGFPEAGSIEDPSGQGSAANENINGSGASPSSLGFSGPNPTVENGTFLAQPTSIIIDSSSLPGALSGSQIFSTPSESPTGTTGQGETSSSSSSKYVSTTMLTLLLSLCSGSMPRRQASAAVLSVFIGTLLLSMGVD
ncbi:hypothetical protein DL96DRAFT_1636389 [Flagelloscypha sp. PMI_526]|nr:hypothetical protein DL96DRAFT_1636389 [Flagelloscypha sp. PMI_526]